MATVGRDSFSVLIQESIELFDDLFRLGQAEDLSPPPCGLVSKNEDIGVRLSVLGEQSQLRQRASHVVGLTRQKVPAGAGFEAGGVLFQSGRSVILGIDRDRGRGRSDYLRMLDLRLEEISSVPDLTPGGQRGGAEASE